MKTFKQTADKPMAQIVRNRRRVTRRKGRKIGFDLHGVIDTNAAFFRALLGDLIRQGWEIHILTGATWEKERETLRKLRIPFTHFFSITDHHVAIGTEVEWDAANNPHMDDYLWSKTKGVYCEVHGITMHFDDSDIYGMFFRTPYVRYYSRDSHRIRKMHLRRPTEATGK